MVEDGIYYNKQGREKTYWKCDKRRSRTSCKANVVLDQQNNCLRKSGEHTHAPDPEKVLVEKSRSDINKYDK